MAACQILFFGKSFPKNKIRPDVYLVEWIKYLKQDTAKRVRVVLLEEPEENTEEYGGV